MKLLLCTECTDLRKLHVGVKSVCLCGQSWGEYQANGRWVQLGGSSKLVSLRNEQLRANVMPESSDIFRRD